MGIFRGPGGTGDATTDAIASQVSVDSATASAKATEAANSASQSATSAANSATSATNAGSSETNAATSASNSASSATASANSATSAASSLTSINAFYLGSASSNPTVDGNGNAVTAGDWYFNTSDSTTRIYTGSTWNIIDAVGATNVAAAGALMDSEVTNLSQVKAFDSSDYATAAQGTTADNALPKAGGAVTGNLSFSDNDKVIFGTGNDLQIYHDGSNSRIQDAGSGNLKLVTDGAAIQLQSATENMIVATPDADVQLYYNGVQKLATTSTGIDVTGNMIADGVGIGTTPNAATVLHVQDTEPQVLISDASNPLQRFMAFDVGLAADEDTHFITVDQADGLAFGEKLNGNDRVIENEWMRITNAGNVGISVTDPIYPLEVQGEAGIELYNASGGGDVLNLRPSLGDANKYNMSISSYDHSGGGVGPADGISINAFDGVSVATGSSTARQERLRIDSSGRLLINKTTNDGGLNLQVQAPTGFSVGSGFYSAVSQSTIEFRDGNTTAAYKVRIGSETDDLLMFAGGSERIRIDSSGNVGIGESNPAEKLEVAGNILLNASSAEVNLRSGVAGTSGAINWTFNTDGTNYASIKLPYDDRNTTGLHIDSGYPITLDASGIGTIFAQSGVAKARIDSSGNFLVGTSNPNPAANNVIGHALKAGGLVEHANSGAMVMRLNRTDSDGSIIEFRKGTGVVGSIGTYAGDLTIGDDDVGIRFDTGTGLVPWDLGANTTGGAATNGAIDIGAASTRFKDLHLSGTAAMGGLTVNGVGSVIALSDNAVFNVNVSGGTSKTSTINQRAKSSNGSNAETSIVVTGSSGEAVSAWDFKLDTANGALTKAMTIDGSGDISFYEDTGTTAKFFWDSSAESLGVGTSSPQALTHIYTESGINTADTLLKLTNVANTARYVGFQAQRDNASGQGLNVLITKTDASVVNALTIDTSANVGIGTSNPSFPLEVDGGTGDGIKIKAGNTSNDDSFLVANSSNTTMFLVDGGGNVGINNSSPATHLHVQGSSGEIRVQDTGSGGGIVSFRDSGTSSIPSIQSSGNNLLVNTGGSGRMRIDASGNVLVGATTFASAGGGHLLAPSGTRSSSRTVTTAAFHNLFYNANGIVGGISTSGSATTFATSSDQRLKDNIVDAPSASDDIDAIQVRSFDWKADGSHQKYGMVAQELQSVAPEAVSEGETEDDMMGVDYSKLVPMLVKEIQSLRARVAQLETN